MFLILAEMYDLFGKNTAGPVRNSVTNNIVQAPLEANRQLLTGQEGKISNGAGVKV